jgi:hypothetical protein
MKIAHRRSAVVSAVTILALSFDSMTLTLEGRRPQ